MIAIAAALALQLNEKVLLHVVMLGMFTCSWKFLAPVANAYTITWTKRSKWLRMRKSKSEKSNNKIEQKDLGLCSFSQDAGKYEINRSEKVWDVVTGCMLCVRACVRWTSVMFFFSTEQIFGTFFYDVFTVSLLLRSLLIECIFILFYLFHALKVWISFGEVTRPPLRYENNKITWFNLAARKWMHVLVRFKEHHWRWAI